MAKKTSGFPLSLHKASGQWCKRIAGHVYYFGKDREQAAIRWRNERDDLYAGVAPSSRRDEPTLAEFVNLFLAAMRDANATDGKPGERHIGLCDGTLGRMLAILGKDCVANDLTPREFARLRAELFKPIPREQPKNGGRWGRSVERRSAGTVGGDIRRIKTFFNWCVDSELCSPPRYGRSFRVSESAEQAGYEFTANEVRTLFNAASVRFRPLLWLGINSGIGNLDIAEMRWSDIDGFDRPECWVNLPRGKTGGNRKFLLWPETAEAIRQYLPLRRKYAGALHEDLVFLTSRGVPWVRMIGEDKRIDSIVTVFTKLRKAVGMQAGSFYDLRRTFSTIAQETLDFPAVDTMMGHIRRKRDMRERYRQSVSDDRLRAVSDHVRQWLLSAKA